MTLPVAAVDIGGTKALVAAFDTGGMLLRQERLEVGTEREPNRVTERLAAAVHRVCDGLPGALGVSVPGPLVRDPGVVSLSPNLGWRDYPLAARLGSLVGVRVVIDDDANCAALGEAWQGAGRSYRNFVMVVVGSGIGAGVVIDGAIYRGAHDSAGEIGHVRLESGGPPCGCGGRGCLEALASGGAITREARRLLAGGRAGGVRDAASGRTVTAEAVFAAAAAGDGDAREVIRSAASWLGAGLALLANVLDPEAFVLGGGIGARGGPYLEQAATAMRAAALAQNVAGVPLIPAELGEASGLYGAARLVLAP